MKTKLEEHPYLTALILVAAALFVQTMFLQIPGFDGHFLFFFAAVAVASWIGGLGPGYFATALSTLLIDYFLIEPTGSFAEKPLSGLGSLLAFFAVAALISSLIHHLRKRNVHLQSSLETCEIARETAEDSNRLKRDFIANMSHEIRAPLSAVLGFSELLTQGTLNQEEKENYMERLKLNAAALTHLVTDLLDVTEIDSARFVANRKRIVLGDFVQKVYSTFTPLAQEKGLKFQVQMRGSLPAYIESDPDQIMQILRHVIGNSIRFCEDGLVKLTVSATKTVTGRRELALIVTDQGPGIPYEIRKKLFQPFARDSEEKMKTHGGTGLGLTIARKFARGLGGDVKLAKTNQRGTTFLITLDAGPVDDAHDLLDQLTVSTPAAQMASDDPHALEGIKVLVVDDSADSALLVSRMLKVVGAEVETADRGLTGIERALSSPYDIVIMDIQMPEMDGYEAIRRLRSKGFDKPIIALSAHVMKEDQEEARRAGSDEYVMKPVSRRTLLEIVGRYARLQKPQRLPAFELQPT